MCLQPTKAVRVPAAVSDSPWPPGSPKGQRAGDALPCCQPGQLLMMDGHESPW